jgi:hypothetical protein
MESSGFGGDIGFVYEYRPDHGADLLDGTNQMKDRNKYKLRAGLSLLDLGKIKYKADPDRSGGYDISITGSERFYLRQLADTDIDDFDSFFRSRPQYFTPVAGNTADYKISLPSTVQLDVDYHVHRGFYTSLAAQIPLATEAAFSSRYYSSFTLTPRYEGRAIGVYLPVNHNSLTNFNAGLSLRAGPLFLGSGSVLSAMLGGSKQVDFHVGLRFGGLQKDAKQMEEKRQRKSERKAGKETKRSAGR